MLIRWVQTQKVMIIIIPFLSHLHPQVHRIRIPQIWQLSSPFQDDHNLPNWVITLFIGFLISFQDLHLQLSVETFETSTTLQNNFHLIVVLKLGFVDISNFHNNFIGDMQYFSKTFSVFEFNLILVLFRVLKELQEPFILGLDFHLELRWAIPMPKDWYNRTQLLTFRA